MPPALLEYDESDDLFDPTEINPSAPISGPSTSSTFHPSAPPRTTSTTRSGFSGNNPSSSTPVPKPSAYPHLPSPWAQNRIATEDGEEIVVDHHYVAALKRRRDKVGEWAVRDVGGEDGRGVRSLKRMCIDLCKIHSARMFDIGDVPYSLVSEFVDIMPVEQLAQVEDASPHLRKDTDWLYELPLHSLFPSFHLSVLLKKGVKRTSGWRRMYKLAGEEAAEKQRNAEARMAERYAELERERERKKVKVLDRAPVGVGGMRRVGGGGVYGREKGPVIKQGSGSFGKLKAESQRINLALKRTLAANASASASSSNRPSIPSTSTSSSSRPISSSTPSSRPPSSHASNVNGNRAPPVAARSVSGPPIPAPRRRAARAQAQAAEARAALPAHLRSATAENVAAKQAGRSMGITDVQPVKPVKSTSAPVSRGAAATSSSSSAVRAVKAGRRGGAAITVGPSASASATGSSMMSGLSSSFQPRNPTSTRIASSTKPPVLDTRTSPATISSSYQPRSAMRQAPLPSASAPTSTPASRQCHTSAPSSAPQSTSALNGSTKRKAEIIDLDAIPPPSLSSATSSAAAANGRSGTAGNTAGMARRLDPVRDKEKLEGVLFRKKPRVGSGGVSKGKIRQ